MQRGSVVAGEEPGTVSWVWRCAPVIAQLPVAPHPLASSVEDPASNAEWGHRGPALFQLRTPQLPQAKSNEKAMPKWGQSQNNTQAGSSSSHTLGLPTEAVTL